MTPPSTTTATLTRRRARRARCRLKDLETWLGTEIGPEELITSVDDTGTVRARYDGEMRRNPEGLPEQHGHAPPPRTKWTRRVPHLVLIGHAASLTPY